MKSRRKIVLYNKSIRTTYLKSYFQQMSERQCIRKQLLKQHDEKPYPLYDGNGNICYWNADNKCEKLSLLSDCSDFSDKTEICSLTCTYDSENTVCRPSSCADFYSEDDCQVQMDLNDFGVIPCIWKNDACSDASESDIQNFDIFSCSKNTLFHYKWSDNTCVQCSQTETSPLFKFITDKIITDLDSTLLSIFGLILILY